jgi:tetratricopeptide (TPR) repeat protein
MKFLLKASLPPGRYFAFVGRWLVVATLVSVAAVSRSNDQPITADKLLNTGQMLAERTHYVEALDLLGEAKDMLEASGMNQTAIYADVLYTLAETKIKARNLQDFPALYVKTALQDIQVANKLREKLPDVLPQKLAAGYYLEGYIHKRFFRRKREARLLLEKAKNIDPGFIPAKREIYELDAEEKK